MKQRQPRRFLRFLLFKIPCQNFCHREAGSFALRRGCFFALVLGWFLFVLLFFCARHGAGVFVLLFFCARRGVGFFFFAVFVCSCLACCKGGRFAVWFWWFLLNCPCGAHRRGAVSVKSGGFVQIRTKICNGKIVMLF